MTEKKFPSDLLIPSGWAGDKSPYHEGEHLLQERTGARAFAEKMGRRVIRDYMTDQHRSFFAELPFVIVGSLDRTDGMPRASMLVGRSGFISSPNPRQLRFSARPLFGDPLKENLMNGVPVALLGVQLETRRRNRLSGKISFCEDDEFTVNVGQSFGNCPRYIQTRAVTIVEETAGVGQAGPLGIENCLLSDDALALIQKSDTFFIATASPEASGDDPVEGVDVSHRGGKPGFVQAVRNHGSTVLMSPDFIGNFAFSTFGNLARNPRAGLLFIDFETGDALSLTGEAQVIWDSPAQDFFSGAERFLRFEVSAGVFMRAGIPLRWSEPIAASEIAGTGSWADVQNIQRNRSMMR